MIPSDRSSRWVLLALITLTLLGLAARGLGIRSGLPHRPEALAISVWQSAANHLPPGKGVTAFAYPSTFYPYLLSGALDVLPGHSYAMPAPADAPFEAHLAAASEPYLRGRILVALLSLLMIPGVFFIARRWLDPGWALFASALLTTSLLVTDYSTAARVHTAVASTSVVAVLGALYLLRRGTLVSYLVAGASAALAVTTLYSGFFALPALFIAHWFAPVRSRATRGTGMVVALAIVAISFRFAYPFLFAGRALSGQGKYLDLAEQHIPWDEFNGQGFGREIAGLWSYDPVLTALACGAVVLGLVALASRKRIFTLDERHAAWVAGSQLLGVYVAFGVFSHFSPRFAIPLVPGAAILGAAAACWSCRTVARWMPARARAVQAVIIVILLSFPAYVCTRLVLVNYRDDTATLAAHWIEDNARPDDPILVDNLLSLPIEQDTHALELLPDWVLGPWEIYCRDWPEAVHMHQRFVHHSARKGFLRDRQIDGGEVRQVLEQVHPRWAVIRLYPADATWRDDTRAVVREIAGEPVVRFWPDEEEELSRSASVPRGESHVLEGVLCLERNGPPIEIYRLPSPPLAH